MEATSKRMKVTFRGVGENGEKVQTEVRLKAGAYNCIT